MLVRPQQSQRWYSRRVRLENEEPSFVEEFRYLGHVMTADSRDDEDIKKNSGGKMRWQCAGQEVLICTYGGKNQLFMLYCYPNYGCAL